MHVSCHSDKRSTALFVVLAGSIEDFSSTFLNLSAFLIWVCSAKNNKQLQSGNTSICMLTLRPSAHISEGRNTQMSTDTH